MHQITQNYFSQLYKNPNSNQISNPILQILAFELGDNSSQSTTQIIIRLSDQINFVDCLLIGDFRIEEQKIIKKNDNKISNQFQKYDLIRFKNFVIQCQGNKICKLRLVIKDIQRVAKANKSIGLPAQLFQYMDNLNTISIQDQIQAKGNSFLTYNKILQNKKQVQIIPIKIQDDALQLKQPIQNIQQKQNNMKDKYLDEQQILTGKQILAGKIGLFMGRLLRIKMTSRQTKQGQLSVLILGFVDKTGQMVRINLAGRTAIRQFKQLKKNKCYSLKGLQPFQTDKMTFPHIKIKQKQFKISQVHNLNICQKFVKDYHVWDHQINSIESQRVDIVGIVQQINEKGVEFQQNQNKQVIRVIIRNMAKSVRVSFWSDQINAFKSSNLRRNQVIIMEDIRKKKNKFLDFTAQSSIIRLDSQPELKARLLYLLPQPQTNPLPTHISQFTSYINSQQVGKIIQLPLFLTGIDSQPHRLIYKICSLCKRKIKNNCRSCSVNKIQQAHTALFEYKYNCQLQFSDFSGSIISVAFDGPCQILLSKTASEIASFNQISMHQLKQDILYTQYKVSIQHKNLRFIVRNIEKLSQQNNFDKTIQSRLKAINKLISNLQ